MMGITGLRLAHKDRSATFLKAPMLHVDVPFLSKTTVHSRVLTDGDGRPVHRKDIHS